MSTLQQRTQKLVDGAPFQSVILALIIVNAVILGAETFPSVVGSVGPALHLADEIILNVFIVEICLRIFAWRGGYFRLGWNVFDIVIVAISVIAATSGLAALRAFRVLRVLRVITVIPRMRVVVSALLDSLPGIASVGVVLTLIIYVFAVIASNLYGADHADLFGDVFTSMYTLFQVMTLEGWPDIAAQVAQTHQRSWMFFFSFVLLATFTMLNLFVAIVVRVVEEDSEPIVEDIVERQDAIAADIAAIRRDLAALASKAPD